MCSLTENSCRVKSWVKRLPGWSLCFLTCLSCRPRSSCSQACSYPKHALLQNDNTLFIFTTNWIVKIWDIFVKYTQMEEFRTFDNTTDHFKHIVIWLLVCRVLFPLFITAVCKTLLYTASETLQCIKEDKGHTCASSIVASCSKTCRCILGTETGGRTGDMRRHKLEKWENPLIFHLALACFPMYVADSTRAVWRGIE